MQADAVQSDASAAPRAPAAEEGSFLERYTAPEQVLPCQHYYMDRGDRTQPELRLLTAILVDAYRCYTLYMRSRVPEEMEAHREAVAWFFGESEGDYAFSFESVCAFLEVSPEAIRRSLRAYAPDPQAPVRMPRRRRRRHALELVATS